MDKNTFAKVIREAMEKKRLTIAQLSEMCLVSVSAMNRYLAAKAYPSVIVAVRMAKAVDLSLDQVFGLHNTNAQLADVFHWISDLVMTKGNSGYLANFDQDHKTIIITQDAFHGAIDFEAWAKLVDLYRQNIVPKEMYDAWFEKKSESFK